MATICSVLKSRIVRTWNFWNPSRRVYADVGTALPRPLSGAMRNGLRESRDGINNPAGLSAIGAVIGKSQWNQAIYQGGDRSLGHTALQRADSGRIETKPPAEGFVFKEKAMARFYFHMLRSDHIDPDPEGTELPDMATAREEAFKSAREILSSALKSTEADLIDGFVIADDSGRELETVLLKDALPAGLC